MCNNCPQIQFQTACRCYMQTTSSREIIDSRDIRKKVNISRDLYSRLLISTARANLTNKKDIGRKLSRNPNIFIGDVERNPDIVWNFRSLSNNPSVTLQYYLDNPQHEWCYCLLSSNPNITMKDVLAHKQIPWCYAGLSLNPNITINDVLSSPAGTLWNHELLSYNLNITPQIVSANPRIQWSVSNLVQNANFTFHDVKKLARNRWFQFWKASSNPNITIKDILSDPAQGNWELADLARYANITMRNAVNNPKIFKNKRFLNMNVNIPIKSILSSGICNGVGLNPNADPMFIAKHKKQIKFTDLLQNRFVWHSEKAYANITLRIEQKRKHRVGLIAQVFDSGLSEIISYYTEMI